MAAYRGPSVKMTLVYHISKEYILVVWNGVVLAVDEVKSQPLVGVQGGEDGTFLTLVMTDLDHSCSRNPFKRDYIQWLVTDIPLGETSVGTGRVVKGYLSPRPGKEAHRYSFVLFKQMPSGRSISARRLSRDKFNISSFALDYNLGDPIAAVYFNAGTPRIAKIIGDVVFLKPGVKMIVTHDDYNPTTLDKNDMAVDEVRSYQPIVIIAGGRDGTDHFTLVMTDLDSPSRDPNRREYVHWLVTDIPAGLSVVSGSIRLDYMRPDDESGTHRYIFMLFKQRRRRQVVTIPTSRVEFSSRLFASENHLNDPVAALWFTARAPRRLIPITTDHTIRNNF